MATAEQVAKRVQERARRLQNQTVAWKVIGLSIDKAIDDSFDASRSVDGAPFQPLKPSTLRKRTKGTGKGLVAKILVDTARARNSARTKAKSKGARWSAVGYLRHHMTGTATLVVRNPTIFRSVGGKRWTLKAGWGPRISRALGRYIMDGPRAIGTV